MWLDSGKDIRVKPENLERIDTSNSDDHPRDDQWAARRPRRVRPGLRALQRATQ
jgi:hypothetical protein